MNVWLGCEYPDPDALALIGYTGKIGPSGKRPAVPEARPLHVPLAFRG